MANREIKKICINGEIIKKEIYEHGFSLRSFSKKIDINDRTLRSYLKKNLMPEYIMDKINQLFCIPLDDKIPIWIRLGVTVLMPESQVFEIMESCENENGTFSDMDISDETAKVLLKFARADGDSYIPGGVLDYWKPWYEKKKKELAEKT